MPTWRLKVNKKIFPNSYGYFQLGGLYIVSYFSVLSWPSETGIYCFQNENQALNYDAILFVKPEKLLKELVLLPFPQWRLELWFWANCPSFQDRLDLRVSSMFPRPHEFLAKVQEAFLTLLGTESFPTLQLLHSEQQDASSITVGPFILLMPMVGALETIKMSLQVWRTCFLRCWTCWLIILLWNGLG